MATDAEVCAHLLAGELEVLGRIVDSSNQALLVSCSDGATQTLAIYKPLQGERALWDYPDGSLVARERAAYLISHAAGVDIVPPTVLRDGPFGPGSVQEWIGEVEGEHAGLVEVVEPQAVPAGWIPVLAAQDQRGRPVLLVHADDARLRTVAVLDAVLNNSDRKGSHLILEGDRLRGIDHGVSLGVEPKVRTVLWGWAGQPLTDTDRGHLQTLDAALKSSLRTELAPLLTAAEVTALDERVQALLADGVHPGPTPGWPAIPWPAL